MKYNNENCSSNHFDFTIKKVYAQTSHQAAKPSATSTRHFIEVIQRLRTTSNAQTMYMIVWPLVDNLGSSHKELKTKKGGCEILEIRKCHSIRSMRYVDHYIIAVVFRWMRSGSESSVVLFDEN